MRKIFLSVAVLIGFAQASAHAGTVACDRNDRNYKLNVANVKLDGAQLVAANEGALVTLWSSENVYFLETPFAMDNHESNEAGWTSLSLSKSLNNIKIDSLMDHSIAVTVTYPGDSIGFFRCQLTN